MKSFNEWFVEATAVEGIIDELGAPKDETVTGDTTYRFYVMPADSVERFSEWLLSEADVQEYTVWKDGKIAGREAGPPAKILARFFEKHAGVAPPDGFMGDKRGKMAVMPPPIPGGELDRALSGELSPWDVDGDSMTGDDKFFFDYGGSDSLNLFLVEPGNVLAANSRDVDPVFGSELPIRIIPGARPCAVKYVVHANGDAEMSIGHPDAPTKYRIVPYAGDLSEVKKRITQRVKHVLAGIETPEQGERVLNRLLEVLREFD